jgi:hypothetical protein
LPLLKKYETYFLNFFAVQKIFSKLFMHGQETLFEGKKESWGMGAGGGGEEKFSFVVLFGPILSLPMN